LSNYEIMGKFFILRRAVNLRMVESLKDLGLGPKQASVLKCIHRFSPISSVRLADLTLSDPAAITRLVDNMVKRGYLVKKDSSTDRRAWDLCLTADGERVAKKIKGIHESIAQEIFGVLSTSDKSKLISLLDRINEKMAALEKEK